MKPVKASKARKSVKATKQIRKTAKSKVKAGRKSF